MEWEERVNNVMVRFTIELSDGEYVLTATRSDGQAADLRLERLPHKDDVAIIFLRNPAFRRMVGME